MLPTLDYGEAARMRQQELLRDGDRSRRAADARRSQRQERQMLRTIRLHDRMLTYTTW